MNLHKLDLLLLSYYSLLLSITLILSRFSTRRNIPRAAENLLFFIEFRQVRTLKSRIKFNFSAAENSANQSYCSLCVPRDQNNSRSVRMIPSSGKPALLSITLMLLSITLILLSYYSLYLNSLLRKFYCYLTLEIAQHRFERQADNPERP